MGGKCEHVVKYRLAKTLTAVGARVAWCWLWRLLAHGAWAGERGC